MNKITISNLNDPDMTRLTERTESHGRSVEEEARAILLAPPVVATGAHSIRLPFATRALEVIRRRLSG